MGKGLGKKIVYETSKYLISKGFKYSFETVSTNAALCLFQNLGGEIISQSDFHSEKKTFTIYLLKSQLSKII